MKDSWSKKLLFLYLVLFVASTTYAQTDISGIINNYTKVTALYTCNNYLTVTSSADFNPTDRVLIIQMQGALIDVTQATTFGDLTGLGISNAGNYEFNEVLSITGNDVYLKYTILNNYSPLNGSVQLIRIPQYTDANIIGTLTAAPWNGNTGGVLVFEVSGNLSFNANIDVSGLGFRGGDAAYNATNPNGSDCNTSSNTVYYYAYPTIQAGKKGEGIAAFTLGRESGRGKNANGGGGGGSHNSGGGGGGNYGNGGRGGDRTNSGCGCIFVCPPNPYGFAASGLATNYNNATNKVFMGGGGGGGHQNNARGLPGANGGGIVIIHAGSISGNSFGILAKGNSNDIFDPGDSGDGTGGGGAGGAVLIGSSAVTLVSTDVSGGKGGDTWYPVRDFGPGGGGGGGVTWSSYSAFPVSDILTTETGGPSGKSRYANTAWNSTNGAAGAKLTGLVLPIATTVYTPAPPCITVPVSLISFTGEKTNNGITLQWITASEIDNSHFSIEKSTDGIHFKPLATIPGNGNSTTILAYSYNDPSPSAGINYYRLKQYDLDNTEHISGFIKVNYSLSEEIVRRIYPNPFTDELFIEASDLLNPETVEIKIFSVVGAEASSPGNFQAKDNTIIFNTSSLSKGVYFLQIVHAGNTEIRKVIKE